MARFISFVGSSSNLFVLDLGLLVLVLALDGKIKNQRAAYIVSLIGELAILGFVGLIIYRTILSV